MQEKPPPAEHGTPRDGGATFLSRVDTYRGRRLTASRPLHNGQRKLGVRGSVPLLSSPGVVSTGGTSAVDGAVDRSRLHRLIGTLRRRLPSLSWSSIERRLRARSCSPRSSTGFGRPTQGLDGSSRLAESGRSYWLNLKSAFAYADILVTSHDPPHRSRPLTSLPPGAALNSCVPDGVCLATS